MLRKFVFITMLFCVLALPVHANPLEDKIRDMVVGEFSKILNHPVRIAKLEGNLLKRAIFRDVVVLASDRPNAQELAHLKLVVIEYNLTRVLTSGGDFLSSIKSIKIDGAQLLIDRNARGDLNWGFAAGDSAAPPPVLNFSVSVKNGTLKFRDARGFGPQAMVQGFGLSLSGADLNLQLTPDGLARITLKANATQAHAQSPLKINGYTRLDGKAFEFKIVLDKSLAIADLAEYFLPLPGIHLTGGMVGGQISIANKVHSQTMPMDLNARLQVQEGVVAFDGLGLPVRNILGVVSVQNDTVQFSKTQARWGSSPLLVSGKIIGERFDMQVLGKAFALKDLSQAFEILKDQKLEGTADLQIDLKGKVSDPEFMNLQMQPLALYGGLGNLKMSWGELDSKSRFTGTLTLDQFDASLLSQTREVSGTASAVINFWGPQAALEISVSADAAAVSVQNQNLGQIQARLKYVPDTLKIMKATLSNASSNNIGLSGNLDFKRNNFQLQLEPSQWKLNTVTAQDFSGIVLSQGSLAGPLNQSKFEIKDYTWQGQVALRQVLWANQWIENAKLDGQWVSGNLSINELSWQADKSQVRVSGELNQNEIKHLEFLPGSTLALSDVDLISERYPELTGQLSLEGQIQGRWNKPQLNMQFTLSDLQNPEEDLKPVERVALNLMVSGNGAVLKNGVLRYQGEELAAQGQVDFKTVSGNIFKLVPRSVAIETKTLDLEQWSNLWAPLQAMFDKWSFRKQEVLGPASFSTNQKFQLGLVAPARERVLHRPDLRSESELYYFFQAIKDLQVSSNIKELHFLRSIKGQVSGKLDWQVRPQSPWEITGDLSVDGLRYKDLAIGKLKLLSEKKAQGISASLAISDLSVTRGAFESVSAAVELDAAQTLKILSVQFKKSGESPQQVLSGVVPLRPLWVSSNEAISLNVHIPGSLLSLLLVRTPGIAQAESNGVVDIGIAGPWSNVKMFSHRLDFVGTKIYFDKGLGFATPFEVVQQDLTFANNRLQVRNLEIDWQGEDTKNQPNHFKFSGSIGFEQVKWNDLKEFPVNLDLQLQDGDYTFNLPSMLVSTVKLRNLSMRGIYPFALSKKSKKNIDQRLKKLTPVGPTLNADVTLEDGTILVATKGGPPSEKLLFEMQINLNIGVAMNVGVQGGLLGSDLSNLLSRYQFELGSGASLNVAGNMNYPRIDGTLTLGSGYLAMFNRNFELAAPTRQREYYQGDLTRVKKNQVRFKPIASSDDSLVSSIYFSMAAETVIEGIATTKNQKVTENLYLVLVEGPLSNLSAIGFEKYSSTDKKPDKKIGDTFYLVNPETGKKLEPERMNELLTDLAPDFLRAMVINQGRNTGKQGLEVQGLARDLTAEQLNVAFRQLLRPTERKLAKSVGLYDIQFQRDFSDVAGQIFRDNSTNTTTGNAQKLISCKWLSSQSYSRIACI
jgi:hypothetical protein